MHGVTHVTIQVAVQSEHEPYGTNGDTFYTNSLRIMRTTLCILSSTTRTKCTKRPKNGHSGIKVDESAIPYTIFL